MFKTLAVAGLSLSCLLVSGVASANWQLLNDKSQLSFVSIKKNSIAEASHFTQLSGQLSEQGQFSVNVDLTSAETFIPIRNERLSKILFESDTFANAVFGISGSGIVFSDTFYITDIFGLSLDEGLITINLTLTDSHGQVGSYATADVVKNLDHCVLNSCDDNTTYCNETTEFPFFVCIDNEPEPPVVDRDLQWQRPSS